jgi:hypothetical protein
MNRGSRASKGARLFRSVVRSLSHLLSRAIGRLPRAKPLYVMKYAVVAASFSNAPAKQLDAARYLDVKRAKQVCVLALGFEEKLSLLLGNFLEFENELLSLAQAFLIWTARDLSESMQERLTLDRRLVNLLTACRLYLDQTGHMLSDLFGNPSKQLEEVKQFRNRLYDERWGYRFMEALRNHVQHADLPVNTISYNFARRTGDGPDYFQYSVIPQSEVKTLAEDGEFKGSVLKEMEEMEQRIDLRGPAREYVSCLYEVHQKIRELIAPLVKEARATYEASVEEFSTADGQKLQFVRLVEFNDDGTSNDEVALVLDFLEYHEKLVKRNRIRTDLQRSFASNSDQKVK